MKKRLSIFSLTSNTGVVNDYIIYLLKQLKEYVDKIIIVCSGDLSLECKNKLKEITEDILIKENNGFYVWNYKYAIDYIGWETMENYDNLTLLNDSVYGPFIVLEDIFRVMENKKIDFWGITKGFGGILGQFHPYINKPLPQYIESYFMCFNKRVINSYAFQLYWKNLKPMNNEVNVYFEHEIYLTQYLKDVGLFSYDTFVNQDGLEETSIVPLLFDTEEMIKMRKCPFIKREIFFSQYIGNQQTQLYQTTGQNVVNTFEYIKKNLEYDTNLIIKDLLKNQHLSDIKNSLHLNYILPYKVLNTPSNLTKQNKKIALFAHIFYEQTIYEIFEYAKNMPYYSDIVISTTSEEMKVKINNVFRVLKINNLKVIVGINKGRDVGGLLITLKPYVYDYDYICFVHSKVSKAIGYLTIGKSFFYRCIENLLKSTTYIENIISILDEDENLGILCPPPPYHGPYVGSIGNEWTMNYPVAKKLLRMLKIDVPMAKDKEPIAPLGSMFWFKTDAIRNIFDYNWDYDDFPKEPMHHDGTISHAIERSYGLIAQSNGYYTGYVMNDEFASLEFNNIRLLMRQYSKETPINIYEIKYMLQEDKENLNTIQKLNRYLLNKKF